MVATEVFRSSSGAVVGALIRHWSGTSLRTLTCFVEDDRDDESPLYEVESRIEFDSSDPFSFTHLVHLTGDGSHRLSRDDDAPADVLPAYAEYLVVGALAGADAGDSHETTATVLDETTGSLTPTVFRREGDRVVRRVDDTVVVSHEVSGAEVISSDWGDGFTSVVVEGPDAVAEAVPARVQHRVARFLDDLERG